MRSPVRTGATAAHFGCDITRVGPTLSRNRVHVKVVDTQIYQYELTAVLVHDEVRRRQIAVPQVDSLQVGQRCEEFSPDRLEQIDADRPLFGRPSPFEREVATALNANVPARSKASSSGFSVVTEEFYTGSGHLTQVLPARTQSRHSESGRCLYPGRSRNRRSPESVPGGLRRVTGGVRRPRWTEERSSLRSWQRTRVLRVAARPGSG